ncbi:MAG: YcaO-like family protein [bacterium]
MTMQSIVGSIVDRLDLRVSVINPTQRVFPFLFDYDCTISTEWGTLIGRGTSCQQDKAIFKAIGETLELYTFVSDKTYETTNGMSFHTDTQEAKIKSALELVERDSYICHFYTRTPFLEIGDETRLTILNPVSEILAKHSINLFVARMKSTSDVFASIAVTEGKESILNYGLTIGLGCSPNPIESINSAIIEAVRSLPAYLAGQKMERITLTEFYACETVGPVEYSKLSRDLESSCNVLELFRYQKSEDNILSGSIEDLSITYNFLNMPSILKDKAYVIKASSTRLQEIFFSKDASRHLTKERLKEFSSVYSPDNPYISYLIFFRDKK